jgi:hypothetical protein
MNDISINTPALLFPAITLLMLAYTNRFLAMAERARKLNEQYEAGIRKNNLVGQVKNIRSRIHLVRYMQALSVLSFLLCLICMYFIFRNWMHWANYVFAAALFFLFSSIFLSLIEIFKSTKALEMELSNMEELSGASILKDIFDKEN